MALHIVYEAVLDPHPSVGDDLDVESLLTGGLSGRGTVVVLLCQVNETDPGNQGDPNA